MQITVNGQYEETEFIASGLLAYFVLKITSSSVEGEIRNSPPFVSIGNPLE